VEQGRERIGAESSAEEGGKAATEVGNEGDSGKNRRQERGKSKAVGGKQCGPAELAGLQNTKGVG
jgi:hypothetical protein